MRTFADRVGNFVRERLEMRSKMDEPTLRKYRTVFGIHVRSAAELIAIAGFIIYATFLSGDLYRHRYIGFTVNLISALCYLSLVLGINANLGWAHWPYFFINPISLFIQIIILITAHLNATPHEHDSDAKSDHLVNMVTLIIFIGALLLLHGYCMYIVYRSYEYMLDYLRKEAQFNGGEEMLDIQPAEDVETVENGEAHILK
ncbi:hypothetical protein M3Y97_00184500 [Aphelenchoides bicaudatus]|nr:hypothetical protein M3Y97_00184500 [Aphelenchoides bicaudatus]